jgi:hypothetical protein
MSDVDFKQVIQNIREAINPEVGIPTDQESNPLNYRIQRLTELMAELQIKHQEVDSLIQKAKVNFNELLVNINAKKTTDKKAKASK